MATVKERVLRRIQKWASEQLCTELGHEWASLTVQRDHSRNTNEWQQCSRCGTTRPKPITSTTAHGVTFREVG